MALTAPEMIEVASSPTFQSRLVEATTFTGDYDAEAGFIVRHAEGERVVISQVVHPDTEYIEAVEDAELHPGFTPQQRLNYLTEIIGDTDTPATADPTVNLGRLIMGDEGGIRTDLAIISHTHPLTHSGRRALVPEIRRLLMPSATDLINFADCAAANPGLIAATIAAHTKLGGIAFFPWRVGEPDALQRIAAQIEPPTQERPRGTEIDEAKMAALGLRFTTITFHRQTGTPMRGLGTITTKLFA